MGDKSKIEPSILAYLAGMIDGDGYISVTRSVRGGVEYFGAQVGIAGTRREPHDLAASIWGGKVSCYRPANLRHRPQFQWSRVGASAVAVIEAILPFLLVKRDHAYLALELHEHATFARTDDPFPWFGPNYEPNDRMREMRDEMIGLNQSRSRSRRLLDGREHSEWPGARP
ncbi:MAG: hypothetical protein PHR16_16650 [Methylovulum sp.]|nr:hypothetical protein [Methylovulum sp.]